MRNADETAGRPASQAQATEQWAAQNANLDTGRQLKLTDPASGSHRSRITGVVHATVVLEFAGTVEPLGLCLDGARGRWELVALEYPSVTPPAIAPPTRDLPSGRSTPTNNPFRRARSLDRALGIPLGPPQHFQPHDPAWPRQLPEAPGIDLE
jgi:hypothetical protein